LTKRQAVEVEEGEARARGLIADIIPKLHDLPADVLPEVSKHLELALAAAKAATGKVREKGEVK
jgi:hypothetical protein